MMRITSLLGFLALALNVAMGYSGSVLFCEHESGDSHVVSRADYSAAGHEASCHDHGDLAPGEAAGDACCGSCTDVEVGGDELKDLARSSNQERLAGPPVVAVEFVGFDLAALFDSGWASLLPVTRAPLSGDSLTRLQLKRTVLRL